MKKYWLLGIVLVLMTGMVYAIDWATLPIYEYDLFDGHTLVQAYTNYTDFQWSYGHATTGSGFHLRNAGAGYTQIGSTASSDAVILWPKGFDNSWDAKAFGKSSRYIIDGQYNNYDLNSYIGVCLGINCTNRINIYEVPIGGQFWDIFKANITFNYSDETVDLIFNGVLVADDIDISGNSEWYPYFLTKKSPGANMESQWIVHDIKYQLNDSVDVFLNCSNERFPINETSFNINIININSTVNSSWNFTVNLFINNTLNQTRNFTNGQNVFVSFNVTAPPGHYMFNMNITDNYNSNISSNNTFYIDIIDPAIVDNFVNNSFYSRQNITGQFNFSDNYWVYSYNISIDGINIAGSTNILEPTAQYNLSYDISGLEAGNHTLTIRTADGHTANKLKAPYKIKDGFFNNKLGIEYPDGGEVWISSKKGGLFDRFRASAEVDRYRFSYLPIDDKQNKYTFVIESDQTIHIIETDSKYQNYIIIGDHWIDFVLPEEINSNVRIDRISDTQVEVIVSGITKGQELKFDSAGDLNIVTKTYSFVTTNAALTYSATSGELEEQTIIFQINTSSNILSTNATLLYNNTYKAMSKIQYDEYDNYQVTFNTPVILTETATESRNITVKYNINSVAGWENGSINVTQIAYKIGIDNCSASTGYSIRAYNISMYNETNNADHASVIAHSKIPLVKSIIFIHQNKDFICDRGE